MTLRNASFSLGNYSITAIKLQVRITQWALNEKSIEAVFKLLFLDSICLRGFWRVFYIIEYFKFPLVSLSISFYVGRRLFMDDVLFLADPFLNGLVVVFINFFNTFF